MIALQILQNSIVLIFVLAEWKFFSIYIVNASCQLLKFRRGMPTLYIDSLSCRGVLSLTALEILAALEIVLMCKVAMY